MEPGSIVVMLVIIILNSDPDGLVWINSFMLMVIISFSAQNQSEGEKRNFSCLESKSFLPSDHTQNDTLNDSSIFYCLITADMRCWKEMSTWTKIHSFMVVCQTMYSTQSCALKSIFQYVFQWNVATGTVLIAILKPSIVTLEQYDAAALIVVNMSVPATGWLGHITNGYGRSLGLNYSAL
jgi:hypothetical protein